MMIWVVLSGKQFIKVPLRYLFLIIQLRSTKAKILYLCLISIIYEIVRTKVQRNKSLLTL